MTLLFRLLHTIFFLLVGSHIILSLFVEPAWNSFSWVLTPGNLDIIDQVDYFLPLFDGMPEAYAPTKLAEALSALRLRQLTFILLKLFLLLLNVGMMLSLYLKIKQARFYIPFLTVINTFYGLIQMRVTFVLDPSLYFLALLWLVYGLGLILFSLYYIYVKKQFVQYDLEPFLINPETAHRSTMRKTSFFSYQNFRKYLQSAFHISILFLISFTIGYGVYVPLFKWQASQPQAAYWMAVILILMMQAFYLKSYYSSFRKNFDHDQLVSVKGGAFALGFFTVRLTGRFIKVGLWFLAAMVFVISLLTLIFQFLAWLRNSGQLPANIGF